MRNRNTFLSIDTSISLFYFGFTQYNSKLIQLMTDLNDPFKESGPVEEQKGAGITNVKSQEEPKETSPAAADKKTDGDGNHPSDAPKEVTKPKENNTKSTDGESSKEGKSLESDGSAPPRDRQYAKDLLLGALLVFILASFLASNLPD